MNTIREIEDNEGDVWSLVSEDGALFLMHRFNDAVSLSCIPVSPMVLEIFASDVRNATPIHAREQNVIPFRKFIPGSPRSVMQ